MARRNPEVERLEAEVAFLRKELQERKRDPGDYPFIGCDNSCIVAKPTGMATNGGCRCSDRTLRLALIWWKRRAAFLEETIRTWRETDDPENDATDFAHPAWWRGQDYGGSNAAKCIEAILEGITTATTYANPNLRRVAEKTLELVCRMKGLEK